MRDIGKTPYHELGESLKSMRLENRETLAEVSGAVEIEQDELKRIEQGRQCPNEELLMLLISHFDIDEDKAVNLWEMAGYDKQADDLQGKQAVIVIPMDGRIVYSDKVQVTVSKYGVVMNFIQSDTGHKQIPVSRVGMSKAHARRVMEVLRETLEQSEKSTSPKLLPGPDQTDK